MSFAHQHERESNEVIYCWDKTIIQLSNEQIQFELNRLVDNFSSLCLHLKQLSFKLRYCENNSVCTFKPKIGNNLQIFRNTFCAKGVTYRVENLSLGYT